MSSSSRSESTPAIEGPYAASRSAWVEARSEAKAAIEKLKALVARTRDPRAAQVSSALERIIRRLPDTGSALEALADAEETGGDVAGLKDQARKTSQLSSYYMRSDRLVAMVRANPFFPVSVDKIFAPALQTIQRELK